MAASGAAVVSLAGCPIIFGNLMAMPECEPDGGPPGCMVPECYAPDGGPAGCAPAPCDEASGGQGDGGPAGCADSDGGSDGG